MTGTLIALLIQLLLASSMPTTDVVPGPAFQDVISLRSISSPAIAPDGRAVAYVESAADWQDNRFDREIWLVRVGQPPFQLTRNDYGVSDTPRWSPDGQWIAFLSDRGRKRQVHLMRADGGEPWQLTDAPDGVGSYQWAPDGWRVAYTAVEPEAEDVKARRERYGDYTADDGESRMTHLWLVDLTQVGVVHAGAVSGPRAQMRGAASSVGAEHGVPARRLTGGTTFAVKGFEWSPDGRSIAFNHEPDPRFAESGANSDIAVLDVESGRIRPLVTQPGADVGPKWSPDGQWIAFATMMGDSAPYRNRHLAKIPAAGGTITVLARDHDESKGPAAWTRAGLFVSVDERTERRMYRVDPETGAMRVVAGSPAVLRFVDFSANGETMAAIGESDRTLGEIYLIGTTGRAPVRLTDYTAQTTGWPLGTRELTRWKSRDGTEIEGVQPGVKYPLMVVIHGGPLSTSRPLLVPGSEYSEYPVLQWLAKGTVVLMPNYRGSTGYGESFRSLNVRNLGVGDAWDVLSGVDHLVKQGIADSARVAAMGWSQGGYISAFLATTSDRFRAISVGAGISDWVTYHVNTDNTTFTSAYLRATPWDDPEIYAKTSPITYLAQASTPTLIQHGELDRRVPIANANLLFQGLRDRGVETRLIVYKGLGHGISRPKEQLAAMWHNWQWFAKHVWGEEVDLPLN
jgi:dipeptidyl aminopeptidase/acylaminoacyl peptidase